MPVQIVDYDPGWPHLFQSLRERVLASLGELAYAVEHVGSTAVPGLAAKPIVDIDVVVASSADIPEAIERLATLGYVHQGDFGICGREAFAPPSDVPAHHLYLCGRTSAELHRHLLFRDYLRTHPEDAAAYASVKRSAAEMCGGDRSAYTEAKSAFIVSLLRRAARMEYRSRATTADDHALDPLDRDHVSSAR